MLRKRCSLPCWHDVRSFRKAGAVLTMCCSVGLLHLPAFFGVRKRRGSFVCLCCVFLQLYLHVSVFL